MAKRSLTPTTARRHRNSAHRWCFRTTPCSRTGVQDNVAFGHQQAPEAQAKKWRELLGNWFKLSQPRQALPHELFWRASSSALLWPEHCAPYPKCLFWNEPSQPRGNCAAGCSGEVRDILKLRGTSAMLVTHDRTSLCRQRSCRRCSREGHCTVDVYALQSVPRARRPLIASFIGQGYFIRGQLISRHRTTELAVITR